jgi:hypothetical protein
VILLAAVATLGARQRDLASHEGQQTQAIKSRPTS